MPSATSTSPAATIEAEPLEDLPGRQFGRHLEDTLFNKPALYAVLSAGICAASIRSTVMAGEHLAITARRQRRAFLSTDVARQTGSASGRRNRWVAGRGSRLELARLHVEHALRLFRNAFVMM